MFSHIFLWFSHGFPSISYDLPSNQLEKSKTNLTHLLGEGIVAILPEGLPGEASEASRVQLDMTIGNVNMGWLGIIWETYGLTWHAKWLGIIWETYGKHLMGIIWETYVQNGVCMETNFELGFINKNRESYGKHMCSCVHNPSIIPLWLGFKGIPRSWIIIIPNI